MMQKEHPRRTFLARTAVVLGAFLPGLPLHAQTKEQRKSDSRELEPWLQGLHGKHRQFFDVGSIQNGAPLRRVAAFVNAYVGAYGLAESDIVGVFGAHGSGISFVLSDKCWARFDLGKRNGVVDPRTGEPAKRNVFYDSSGPENLSTLRASVAGLQTRGIRFWACKNTMDRLSAEFATELQVSEETVRRELTRGLLPGVTIVPAMIVACNRAQEIGLSYAFLS